MVIVPRGSFAQTATNNIVNMAVIYSANSPLTTSGIINAQSNVFIGGVLEAGTNSSAGTSVGVHFLSSSNAGNPVLVLRSYDPTGKAGFNSKNSLGVDSGYIGTDRNGSNIVIHAFLNALSYIRLTTQSGSAANEMFIHPGYTTNAGPFWANSVNSTNYMANGVSAATRWSTNLGIGQTNVLVFTNGLYMGQFTIP